jgi:hypothetical protein
MSSTTAPLRSSDQHLQRIDDAGRRATSFFASLRCPK